MQRYYAIKITDFDLDVDYMVVKESELESVISGEGGLEDEGYLCESTSFEDIPALTLFNGRHDIPTEEAVFDGPVEDPRDIKRIRYLARKKIWEYIGEEYVLLYVTGLTVALIETVKVCKEIEIIPILMHYDKKAEEYYPQLG